MESMKTGIEMFQVQCFSIDGILQYVPANIYNKIKAEDPNPEFRAYTITHEGQAFPTLMAEGRVGKIAAQFFGGIIRTMNEKMALGTKLFARHVFGTNDHEGRVTVGEVVGKALDNIDGRLSNIAIAYIKPEHRSRQLNVASIEADIRFSFNGTETEAVEVDNVTGIALSSSEDDRPAFPGAQLLASVQAFVDDDNSGRGGTDKEHVMAMTKADIKRAISEAAYSPSDLFDKDSLEADAVVEEIGRAVAQSKHEELRRVKESLGQKLDTAKAEIESLKGDVVRGKTMPMLDALSAERKLTERQKSFIADTVGDIKADDINDEDGLKSALNAHIDEGLKRFGKYFGEDSDDSNKGDDDKKSDADPKDGAPQGAPPKIEPDTPIGELTDPQKNPFIP